MSDFDQNNQKVNTQVNVGRDQVIHNLVLVGQFLDFTQIEGLLPKSKEPNDLSSIVKVIDGNFSLQFDDELAMAAAFAGEVLSGVIKKFPPINKYAMVPFRQILAEAPRLIHSKLDSLNYWEIFSDGNSNNKTINLEAVSMLWLKHFKVKISFTLEEKIVSQGRSGFDYIYSFSGIDPSKVTQEQFRVFLVGLIIDLMRLYSMGAVDIKFWQEIIGLVSTKSN